MIRQLPKVPLVAEDHQIRMPRLALGQNVAAVIGRYVVDDNYFVQRPILRRNRINRPRKKIGVIVVGEHN